VASRCLADWLVGNAGGVPIEYAGQLVVSLSVRVPSVLKRVDSVGHPIVNVPDPLKRQFPVTPLVRTIGLASRSIVMYRIDTVTGLSRRTGRGSRLSME